MGLRLFGLIFILVGIGALVFYHQSHEVMAAVMGALFVLVGGCIAIVWKQP